MKQIDLHVHSNKSDGTLSPAELVDLALAKGLSAFALTDHDCVDGLKEAITYAKDKEIEVVPGIELSSEYKGRDIHILGLYIDYKSPSFISHLTNFVNARHIRNEEICAKLQGYQIPITYEALLQDYPDAVITRAHFGAYLEQNGFVKSKKEAFDRYIGDHAPCFVPRTKITPMEAIALILNAGGIPVLAHPILYGMGNTALDLLVNELTDAGLVGIETIYSTYSAADERQIRKLATKYNLLLTGGSDFHGANKPTIDLGSGRGNLFVYEELLTKLKATKKRILFSDMDGTLLRNDGTISTALQEAIASYLKDGNHLVLASGRPLDSILSVMNSFQLPLANTYCIAFNGACIYDIAKKQPCYQNKLDKSDIDYVITEAKKWGLHIQGYNDSHIICEKETAELQYYTSKIKLPVLFTEDLAKTLEDGTYKLLIINLQEPSKLIDFRNSLCNFAKDRLQLIFSNPNFLEIFSVDAGKGNAIKYLCKQLHINLENAYAAGDAENDLSMLTVVGHGIAMKNATEIVKTTATTITQNDNNNDGLLEFFNDRTVN